MAARLLWLLAECCGALARFGWLRCWQPDSAGLAWRALWLQSLSRRALRLLGVSWHHQGPVPDSGLLVGNHLSYLDILVLSAIAPCVFVAKEEVRRWPGIGWLARLGGTVFVSRAQRLRVGTACHAIAQALQQDVLVVVFAEGTSSNGATVLPFKSPLLEPALAGNWPVATVHLSYEMRAGNPAKEVCYWGDMTLLPHLLNLCSTQGIEASVTFGAVWSGASDRKTLSRWLHAEVLKLKRASWNP